jgi:hypothetical protein
MTRHTRRDVNPECKQGIMFPNYANGRTCGKTNPAGPEIPGSLTSWPSHVSLYGRASFLSGCDE